MSRARLTVVACVVLALVGAAALGIAQRLETAASAPSSGDDPASRSARTLDDAAELLRGWDARRAEAYARADVDALRALYADGSVAGRRDVRVLRAYRHRGLRVAGLTTQLLRVHTAHREDDEVVLRVTDRVSGAVAVGRGHRIRLPASAARGRRVTLVRHLGTWVVAEVRRAGAR